MPLYTGIGGARKEITAVHCGIGGVKRELSELWAGVNGAKRQIFSGKMWTVTYAINAYTKVKPGKRFCIELNGEEQPWKINETQTILVPDKTVLRIITPPPGYYSDLRIYTYWYTESNWNGESFPNVEDQSLLVDANINVEQEYREPNGIGSGPIGSCTSKIELLRRGTPSWI